MGFFSHSILMYTDKRRQLHYQLIYFFLILNIILNHKRPQKDKFSLIQCFNFDSSISKNGLFACKDQVVLSLIDLHLCRKEL